MKLSNFTLEEILALLRYLNYATIEKDPAGISAREKLRAVRNKAYKVVRES